MAGSRFAYVRNFELPDPLIPNTFMVFRLDGHSFHRFSDEHAFAKPNDERALDLMDHAARDVMEEYKDIVLGFGESDEFSFLLRKSTSLYNRRSAKIATTLTSLFTSCYVFRWNSYFPDNPLKYPPSFDGRIVLYPTEKEVKDYFAWRQADTHVNNLYNTAFWALVQQGGETTTQAHATLRGTVSSQKHEIMFSRFGINYNEIDPKFRKGNIIVRTEIPSEASIPTPFIAETPSVCQTTVVDGSTSQTSSSEPVTSNTPTTDETETSAPSSKDATDPQAAKVASAKAKKAAKKVKPVKPRTKLEMLHVDLIKDEFWVERPGILAE